MVAVLKRWSKMGMWLRNRTKWEKKEGRGNLCGFSIALIRLEVVEEPPCEWKGREWDIRRETEKRGHWKQIPISSLPIRRNKESTKSLVWMWQLHHCHRFIHPLKVNYTLGTSPSKINKKEKKTTPQCNQTLKSSFHAN